MHAFVHVSTGMLCVQLCVYMCVHVLCVHVLCMYMCLYMDVYCLSLLPPHISDVIYY